MTVNRLPVIGIRQDQAGRLTGMRILLTEGSGLTSRQVATRLGDLGHDVEILSSTRFCLTRFTRHVRQLHLVPGFARSPLGWLAAAKAVAKRRSIDVLFPTQEQVAVLSALNQTLEVPTIVPDFGALRRVQDKISAFRTLNSLGIPQPHAVVVRGIGDLAEVTRFPVFVKQPISTASGGVRRASSPSELDVVAIEMQLGRCDLLVQEFHEGPLAMVQAVADAGRLMLAPRRFFGNASTGNPAVNAVGCSRDEQHIVS